MNCGYCSKTPIVTICPVCGDSSKAKSHQPPIAERAPPKRAPRVLSGESARVAVVQQIRSLWKTGDKNISVALLVGLGMGPRIDEDVRTVMAIDEAAHRRGWISREEEEAREEIAGRSCDLLGFDPRLDQISIDAEEEIATVVQVHQTKQFNEGMAAPLQAGDWADLWRRVKAGTISEADAIGFGEQWSKAGAP